MARNRRRHTGKGRHHLRRGVNLSVIMNKPLTWGGTFHMVASVNPDQCAGCAICQDICPAGAIRIEKIARVDPERCTGCGRCVAQCPQGALTLFPIDRHLREKAGGAL